jgi:hypothetical protein
MSKKFPFTWTAAGLGLILALVLALGSGADPDTSRRLPLLTLLFISEFGFLITAAGAFWGFKTRGRQDAETASLIAALACVALAVAFMLMGVGLWVDSFRVEATAGAVAIRAIA